MATPHNSHVSSTDCEIAALRNNSEYNASASTGGVSSSEQQYGLHHYHHHHSHIHSLSQHASSDIGGSSSAAVPMSNAGAALLTPIGWRDCDSLSPRWGLSCAALADKVYVFGGYIWQNGQEFFFNDVHVYDSRSSTLKLLIPSQLDPSLGGGSSTDLGGGNVPNLFLASQSGELPPPTANPVSSKQYTNMDGQTTSMYVAGKVCSNVETGTATGNNQVASSRTASVTNLSFQDQASNVPAPRFGCILEACSETRSLILFGGRGTTGAYNDVWRFSVDDRRWLRLWPASSSSDDGSSSSGPTPRCWQTSGFEDGCLYVYGGWNNSVEVLSDLWKFDCVELKWELLSSDDLAVDKSSRFVVMQSEQSETTAASSTITTTTITTNPPSPMGGFSPGANDPNSEATVGYAQLTRPQQQNMPSTPVGGPDSRCYPGTRTCHNSVVWKSGFYVFGGLKSAAVLQDTEVYRFDLRSREWKVLTNKQSYPLAKPRGRISAASVLIGSLWVIHGGLSSYPQISSVPNSEVIAFDLARNQWLKFNDVRVSDGVIHFTGHVIRLSRYGHAGAYSSQLGAALFFGGAEAYASASTMALWRMDLVPSVQNIVAQPSVNETYKQESKSALRKVEVLSATVAQLVNRMDELESEKAELKAQLNAQSGDVSRALQEVKNLQIQITRQCETHQHTLQLLAVMQSLGHSLCSIGAARTSPSQPNTVPGTGQQQPGTSAMGMSAIGPGYVPGLARSSGGGTTGGGPQTGPQVIQLAHAPQVNAGVLQHHHGGGPPSQHDMPARTTYR